MKQKIIAFWLKLKTWVKEKWRRILIAIAILAAGTGVTLNFIPQTPPANNYHVILSYTNSGRTVRQGSTLTVKATVWDDNKTPISGAKVLLSSNLETNVGQLLTTNASGEATYAWPLSTTTGYMDWWLPYAYTSLSKTGVAMYAQFVGDSTHKSDTDMKWVAINRSDSMLVLHMHDSADADLPEILSYSTRGTKTFKAYVTLAAGGLPGASVTVRADGPGIKGSCNTNVGTGYFQFDVNIDTFRKGANHINFWVSNSTKDAVWIQTVWLETERSFSLAAFYPRRRAQTMWWADGRFYWYTGNPPVYHDCATDCGGNTNEYFHQYQADRQIYLGFGDFYSGTNYDLTQLNNIKTGVPTGVKAGVFIWDQLTGASGTYSGPAYCYTVAGDNPCASGGTWAACATNPSGAGYFNVVSYPAGLLGAIANGTNGWVLKSCSTNQVYIYPPYKTAYADTLYALFQQFSSATYDYPDTPLVSFGLSIGGDGRSGGSRAPIG